MANIIGIFDPEDRVSESDFTSTIDALGRTERVSVNHLRIDNISLGHQQSPALSKHEQIIQPLSRDGYHLVLDGRIDNRAQLIDRLSTTYPGSSDAEIVLDAYHKWGDHFLERLIGAFSIILWDDNTDTFLCARDKTGIRNLFYTVDEGMLVVSSNIAPVHRAINDQLCINKDLISEFINDTASTARETFYTDILKLEHGTFLKATDGQINLRRYWDPSSITQTTENYEEIANRFKQLLSEAVRCRLQSQKSPAIKMSGGLDSTAIASIGQNHVTDRLRAYSIVFNDVGDESITVREQSRIDVMEEVCGIDVKKIHGDDSWTLKQPDQYTEDLPHHPCLNPLLHIDHRLLKQASDDSITALLTGNGGNLYDGTRLSYADLFKERKLLTLSRRLRSDPLTAKWTLLWYILVPLFPSLGSRIIDVFSNGGGGEEQAISPPTEAHQRKEDTIPALQRIALDHEYSSMYRSVRDFRVSLARNTAHQYGIELLYPLLDSRLVEFFLSLPTEVLFKQRQKSLFRRSMAGLLPDPVRLQTSDANFNAIVEKGLRSEEVNTVSQYFDDPLLARHGYIDKEELHEIKDEYLNKDDETGTRAFWNLLSVEIWLRGIS